jgi:DNA adenine methylase
MKYMGSKARISKYIAPIINQYITNNNITTYVEPFVGGANMIEHVKCENKYGLDSNKYLIEFLKAIQSGWNPIDEITMTKDFYNEIKNNQDKYPPHIVALAGLCATYNAKWFGGYAGIVHTKIGTERNYYDEAVRNVLKQKENIIDVKFACRDYSTIGDRLSGALIYCDPPYAETTKYKDDFNHEIFWKWVRDRAMNNIVLVSEYSAPEDIECIWSKELTTTLDKNSRQHAVEKLFLIRNI